MSRFTRKKSLVKKESKDMYVFTVYNQEDFKQAADQAKTIKAERPEACLILDINLLKADNQTINVREDSEVFNCYNVINGVVEVDVGGGGQERRVRLPSYEHWPRCTPSIEIIRGNKRPDNKGPNE
jgi:hypothetical protein